MNKIVGDSKIEGWIEVGKAAQAPELRLGRVACSYAGNASSAAGKREVDEVKVFEAFGGDLPVHGVRRKLRGK